MKKNAELLRTVRDHLAYNPTLHKQGSWGLAKRSAIAPEPVRVEITEYECWGPVVRDFYPVSCGSTACCAGHTVLLAGDQFLVDRDAVEEARQLRIAAQVGYCRDAEGVVHRIPERAQELLGLTYTERIHLFSGIASRKKVLELLDQYIKEAESEE